MKQLHTQWDFTSVFPNFETIKKEQDAITKARDAFVAKWQGRTDYQANSQILYSALEDYNAWANTYAGGGTSAYILELMSAKNQLDSHVKAELTKHTLFSTQIANSMLFFPLSLAAIDGNHQQTFLQDPLLAPYRHYLERTFAESRYVLSEKEEALMNLKYLPSYGNWVDMTSKFLSKAEREVILEDGTKAKKTETELFALLKSKKQVVRDSAAVAINSIMAEFAEVATEEMNAILLNKKIDDDLRGYARPDAARHLADDIASETVDVLVETVSKHNTIAHEFYALKAKLLKKKTLGYHERGVPVGSFDRQYPYEEAYKLVHDTFKGLDQQFAAILEQFSNNGQIDVYPAKGKRGGAFCAHYLLSHPTYILLNHTNTLQDVLTLAHEMGHGINNELVREHQYALNFGTPTSTAEVASTFMEDFVLEKLLKDCTKEEQLSLLMQRLDDDISAIFRQVACYQFEQDLHTIFREQGYIAQEELGRLFTKRMQAYMGPAVTQDPGSENWWVYWSHIRTFFYVYSYASGLLISKSLQRMVRRDKKTIAAVKTFLSAGLSQSPEDIFMAMSIDISKAAFWEAGIAEIRETLSKTTALAKELALI